MEFRSARLQPFLPGRHVFGLADTVAAPPQASQKPRKYLMDFRISPRLAGAGTRRARGAARPPRAALLPALRPGPAAVCASLPALESPPVARLERRVFQSFLTRRGVSPRAALSESAA